MASLLLIYLFRVDRFLITCALALISRLLFKNYVVLLYFCILRLKKLLIRKYNECLLTFCLEYNASEVYDRFC